MGRVEVGGLGVEVHIEEQIEVHGGLEVIAHDVLVVKHVREHNGVQQFEVVARDVHVREQDEDKREHVDGGIWIRKMGIERVEHGRVNVGNVLWVDERGAVVFDYDRIHVGIVLFIDERGCCSRKRCAYPTPYSQNCS